MMDHGSQHRFSTSFSRPRRRWTHLAGLFFCCLAALCALAQNQPQSIPQAGSARALQEMADLESRIEEAQRRQAEEQRRLLDASRSLQSVNASLQQKDRLRQEGEQFLKDYDAGARASLAAVERQQAVGHEKIKSSRSALGLSGAVLLAESGSRRLTPASLLALGLLHDHHRVRASVASRDILDLENRRAGLLGKSDHAQRSAELQTVFSQYGVQQLRERHQALSVQVAQAQERSDRQLQEVRELAGRHEELKALIDRLAAQEAARPTPAPSPTPPPPIPPDSQLTTHNAQPALDIGPLTNNNPQNSAIQGRRPGGPSGPQSAISEVPYEDGSAPMASAMRSGQDKDQTDPSGTRYLFWRARPVGVCALAAGKVLFSSSFAGYRHLLIIDHGGGWRSLYGNLVQCPLSPGDAVTPGQSLGQYQAVQGTRAEPLWFEVRQGTQAVAAEAWPALPALWQSRLLAQISEQASR